MSYYFPESVKIKELKITDEEKKYIIMKKY